MLFGGEPVRVEGAVVRDGAAGDGVDILTTGLLEFESGLASFGCSIRTEPDQRVDVYGSDGRISIGIPFNIPPDRPTQVFVTKGGDPPVAPATETLTFETKDPYAAEAERFAEAVLDGAADAGPAVRRRREPAGHRAAVRLAPTTARGARV